jgi:hypothetical protein
METGQRAIAPIVAIFGTTFATTGVRRLVTAPVPITQASHITPGPVESSIKPRRSDYAGVTRKSNACKAVTP